MDGLAGTTAMEYHQSHEIYIGAGHFTNVAGYGSRSLGIFDEPGYYNTMSAWQMISFHRSNKPRIRYFSVLGLVAESSSSQSMSFCPYSRHCLVAVTALSPFTISSRFSHFTRHLTFHLSFAIKQQYSISYLSWVLFTVQSCWRNR